MDDRSHQDRGFLKEKYLDEGLSTYEIADVCDVTKATVLYWLDKHDIQTRKPNEESEIPDFSVTPHGYERVRTRVDGERFEVLIHRLAAVAWFGFDAVCGNEVHHESGHPRDNRESNLKPISKSEHSKITRSRD